jgi:hypothetical protein
MLSIPDHLVSIPLDECVHIAMHEVAELVGQLEPTLTGRQSTLLHQIRLASESLGAARASLLLTPR